MDCSEESEDRKGERTSALSSTTSTRSSRVQSRLSKKRLDDSVELPESDAEMELASGSLVTQDSASSMIPRACVLDAEWTEWSGVSLIRSLGR